MAAAAAGAFLLALICTGLGMAAPRSSTAGAIYGVGAALFWVCAILLGVTAATR